MLTLLKHKLDRSLFISARRYYMPIRHICYYNISTEQRYSDFIMIYETLETDETVETIYDYFCTSCTLEIYLTASHNWEFIKISYRYFENYS